ncbi:MAG TPA: hypothetical protein VNW92_11950 [Polyangiaceae bacterium]|jgi:hypothetical protein|nr:hypothetical protein [Polyangiaceae bacterium]
MAMLEHRARLVEPPTPSRTLFWLIVASTIGTFTAFLDSLALAMMASATAAE